jgi:syringomycin synthetase protein SyrE
MIEHRSVCHLTAAFAAQVRLQPGERVLQFASITFDVSVAEIFTALRAGATLVLRNDAWLESAQAFWASCERHQVNVLRLPMRFWQLLAAEADVPVPACVRFVGCGGEAISPVAIAQWFRREGHRPALLNTYGPTEITVNASWQEITEDSSTWRSIGGPLPTTRIYVLDALLQPVPAGVAGEIHVGGVQVARG